MGLGLLIVEFSRPHSETLQSVELLWTSDRLVAETSNLQHTTLTKETMPQAGFELAVPASERPQAHALDRAATWDRQKLLLRI